MPPELDELSQIAVQQATRFQIESRAIDKAWRAESLADLVKQLKEKAIEDGERIDNDA